MIFFDKLTKNPNLQKMFWACWGGGGGGGAAGDGCGTG